MATISNTPRPAYAWDSTDNCWYPIGTGAHSHNEIDKTTIDAKGDLIVGTANDAYTRQGVGADGSVLVADSTQTTGVNWAGDMKYAGKNKIINGDFGIWQRGTSGFSVGGFTADRMLSDNGTTASRSTDAPNGFAYSIKWTSPGATNCVIRHGIELPATGVQGAFYDGATFTFSIYAKSSVAGKTLTLYAAFADGTNGTARRIVVDNAIIGTTTTSWTRYTYTFSIPAGASISSALCLQMTPYVVAPSADVYFTGIQLEAGSVATPFVPAGGGSQEAELALCQRYYQKLPSAMLIQGYNSSSAIFWWQPKVDMRATPTATLTSTAPYWESVPYTTVGSLTNASLNATKLTPIGGTLVIAGTYGTTPVQSYPTLFSGDYLNFSAEL